MFIYAADSVIKIILIVVFGLDYYLVDYFLFFFLILFVSFIILSFVTKPNIIARNFDMFLSLFLLCSFIFKVGISH